MTTLFLMKPESRVLVCNDLYGGTYRLFMKCFSQYDLKFIFLDFLNMDEISKYAREGVELVWIESPTNPMLRVYDIEEVCRIVQDANPSALVAVDNTFSTPYFQMPLRLGADLAVYSTTKYMGGHSDLVGGAVVTKEKGIYDRLRFFQNSLGAVPSPFDCFLALRGLKTLHLRMERHQENAMGIARYLESNPLVEKVYYPGLESHPQHQVAKKQMSGFSGMVSFEVNEEVNAKRLVESTKLFVLAESLGGVESLIEHPCSMTHRSVPTEDRCRSGLGDRLIRLSVGVEALEDLIEDLENAFAKNRPGISP